MGGKRKRSHKRSDAAESPNKVAKLSTDCTAAIKHPLLSAYYPTVLTLRGYILSALPATSKTRRRKISGLGEHARVVPLPLKTPAKAEKKVEHGIDDLLAKLLDTTLVGVLRRRTGEIDQSRLKDFKTFSQQVSPSTQSTLGDGLSSQSEIVDFAIWSLFHRSRPGQYRPLHLVCHGYQRSSAPKSTPEDHFTLAGIPGLVSHYPNSHVNKVKGALWGELLRIMGKDGEEIMLDLILDCGIFLAVEKGNSNYYQLSGISLSNLPTTCNVRHPCNDTGSTAIQKKGQPDSGSPVVRAPASIMFVRSRMMYARAALNSKGDVRVGLRSIHVLNRFPQSDESDHTLQILKYMFPRQFGLHNVFTSSVDKSETVQPFKDYTLREQEIDQMQRQELLKRKNPTGKVLNHPSLPKRLRGLAIELVKKLQKLHARCAYKELLKHYCPVDVLDGSGWSQANKSRSLVRKRVQRLSSCANPAPEKTDGNASANHSLLNAASATEQVSAFCRAVMSKLIPNAMLGRDVEGKKNLRTMMQYVDRFVHLRRFENWSLHNVYQSLKIGNIQWLIPPKLGSSARTSKTDMEKRKELFLEFLYYCFDSILIPLIRANFHVTESSVHGNRLFYFRHDVWRALTEPSLATMKLSMFEELNTEKARKMLDARTLGFSQIRLLPKASGLRPIMNLRRRVTKLRNGRISLGKSINQVMGPVFNVLSYEKGKQPERLGSALFSTGEIYAKLKHFRARRHEEGARDSIYYFAKVDVQSCFDTIPQRKVVRLIEQLVSEDEYRIARHAEIKPGDSHGLGSPSDLISKPSMKFVARAKATDDFADFEDLLNQDLAVGKRKVTFVDNVVTTLQDKEQLLDLLQEHVERNVVKIGKKYYRQKQGIPQGSVLSTLLCNFFYAGFEGECLGFLDEDSLLLRLIDDFLLITTNRVHAQRFLQVMHNGREEYGIQVNPEKSLASFEVSVDGSKIPRLATGSSFPYCGTMINTKSLEMTKDRERRKDKAMVNSLTVEMSKTPGKGFYRKIMHTLKIQTHAMFLDTSFNSASTVLSSIYQNFLESGMKFYRYAKSMGRGHQPTMSVMIRTIHDLTTLGCVLVQSQKKSEDAAGYRCAVSRVQIEWLASMAFRMILGAKQTQFAVVMAWLDGRIHASRPRDSRDAERLRKVVKQGNQVFGGYMY